MCTGRHHAEWLSLLEITGRALMNTFWQGLDATRFQAAVGELRLRDERGVYWALGGDDGGWHWYDGQKWVRRDPPG